jgi:hypothetical protein
MKPEWPIDSTYSRADKFKEFAELHPREYESLFNNLEKILRLLREGQKVRGFHVNFFRSEGEDVYRIGQTAVQHAKESRLYVYPDEQNHVMHVLTIGTKERQAQDIKEAREIRRNIKPQNASV